MWATPKALLLQKKCQHFSRIVHPQVTPHGISSVFFPTKRLGFLTIPLSSLNQPSVTLPYPSHHPSTTNHAPASVLFGNAHSLSLAISEDAPNDPLHHRRIGSSSLRTPWDGGLVDWLVGASQDLDFYVVNNPW